MHDAAHRPHLQLLDAAACAVAGVAGLTGGRSPGWVFLAAAVFSVSAALGVAARRA